MRVANLGGRDRPVTPVRGPGAFETVRRAIGRSPSGPAVLALVEESVAVAADGGGGPDSSVVGAAARRLGELGCGEELRVLLGRVLEEGGSVRGGGGGERTRAPLQLGEVAAGAALTALARCVRAAGGGGSRRGEEALAMGRAVWQLAAGGDGGRLLSAPCYGAALHLCACVAPGVEASAWARRLYEELGPAANVLHLGCYLRVLAAAGEWAEVDRLWREGVEGGEGPAPNAACLAGVVGHAASPAALRALWAAYEPTVGGAEAWTAPLAAAPMARFLALGCPSGVLEVETRRLEVGCAAHVADRFGNRRYVLRLWRCRALAHEALAAEAEADGKAARTQRHRRRAVEEAREALSGHVSEGAPVGGLVVFREVLGRAGESE